MTNEGMEIASQLRKREGHEWEIDDLAKLLLKTHLFIPLLGIFYIFQKDPLRVRPAASGVFEPGLSGC